MAADMRSTRNSRKSGMRTKESQEEQAVCPVCEEVIMDASSKHCGEEAIQCDGKCSEWFHRKCAGLSKTIFAMVSGSMAPFYCHHCRLDAHEIEIEKLRETVADLNTELVTMRNEIKNLVASQKSSPSYASVAGPAVGKVVFSGYEEKSTRQNYSPPTQFVSNNTECDKKYNIIVYGIKESSKGKTRSERQAEDLESVASVISSIVPSIDSSCVKDLFRLGKYADNLSRPRPIMVKYIRSANVSSILSKCAHLHAPFFIKPDRSVGERLREKTLLEVRWSLISSGIERKDIKLRNSSI